MTDWNCEPSCSRLTRWLTGVLALKKASQLVVISATALPPAAADVAAGGLDVLDELGLLPPHAVVVSARTISAELPRKYEICR
jgi:hypothetical protein